MRAVTAAAISIMLAASTSAASFQRGHVAFHRRVPGAVEPRGQYCCALVQLTKDLQPTADVDELCAEPASIYPATSYCASGNNDMNLVHLAYNIGSVCQLYASGDIEAAKRCFTTGDCGYKADVTGYMCDNGVPVRDPAVARVAAQANGDGTLPTIGTSSSSRNLAATAAPIIGKITNFLSFGSSSKGSSGIKGSAAGQAIYTPAIVAPQQRRDAVASAASSSATAAASPGGSNAIFPPTYISQAAAAIAAAGSRLNVDATRVSSALLTEATSPRQQIDVMNAYALEVRGIYDNYVDFLHSAEAAAGYYPSTAASFISTPTSSATARSTTQASSSAAKPTSTVAAAGTTKKASSTKKTSTQRKPSSTHKKTSTHKTTARHTPTSVP